MRPPLMYGCVADGAGRDRGLAEDREDGDGFGDAVYEASSTQGSFGGEIVCGFGDGAGIGPLEGDGR